MQCNRSQWFWKFDAGNMNQYRKTIIYRWEQKCSTLHLKSLPQFVLFELCFNVKIISNGCGLPERGKKSCWWVIWKVTFATEGNSVYLKQFHHHIYWPLFTALKIQIGQQLIFSSFVKLKCTFICWK